MSELVGRGIFRPTKCTGCGRAIYTDTVWSDGQLVKLTTICRDCEAGS